MELPIRNGVVLIDKEDYDLVKNIKWYKSDRGYAIWRGKVGDKEKTIRMHRLIANTPEGLVTDHINHNTLDNRRSNLRVVTQRENCRNRKNPGKGYWINKGKTQNPYVVDIYGIHRGVFATQEEAEDFVKLVRAGKADRKEVEVATHCKYGHSFEDAYWIGRVRRCKPCQSRRSKEYHNRKKLSRGKNSDL